MLMSGERESRHLTSAVGECHAASPLHPSFLGLTWRVMQRYTQLARLGWREMHLGDWVSVKLFQSA